MGEAYHKAVSKYMQHIVVREEEPLDARPMFEKQTDAMDTILQPLRVVSSIRLWSLARRWLDQCRH